MGETKKGGLWEDLNGRLALTRSRIPILSWMVRFCVV